MMSDDNVSKQVTRFRSIREHGVGMERKSILIGDRLRHVVHNGALLMPKSAVELIDKRLFNRSIEDFKACLPSVDSIIRPTLNQNSVLVTYLRERKILTNTTEAEKEHLPAAATTVRTLVTNKLWDITAMSIETDRLRGGAGTDVTEKPGKSFNASFCAETSKDSSKAHVSSSNNSSQKIVDSEGGQNKHVHPDPTAPFQGMTPITVDAITSSAAYNQGELTNSTHSLHERKLSQTIALQSSDVASEPKNTELKVALNIEQHASVTNSIRGTSSKNIGLQQSSSKATTYQDINQMMYVDEKTSLVRNELISKPVMNVPCKALQSSVYLSNAITSKGNVEAISDTSSVIEGRTKSLNTTNLSSKCEIPRTVIPLSILPIPQYAQYIPGPNDEMQVEVKNSSPFWYNSIRVSELERTMLPEWFDESAQHRNEESYLKSREQILKMSNQLGNRFVTTALIRRTITGDVGSLNRLFQFLISYGLINADAINDSTPTTGALRPTRKRTLATSFQNKLVDAISKKHKVDAVVDWQSIAEEVGDSATADQCKKNFLNMSFENPQTFSATNDAGINLSSESSESRVISEFKHIINSTNDNILNAALNAALDKTQCLEKVQMAAITAILTSAAVSKGRAEELSLSQVLAELNAKRMQRLEKRIELLDDIEGMMEAERMALELERRDLYTARCRQWFGGSA